MHLYLVFPLFLLLLSSENNKNESDIPTQNQLIQKNNTFFYISILLHIFALKYLFSN